MFVAMASGESLWPKHTGQANAARGAATSRQSHEVFASHLARLKPRASAVGILDSRLVFRWNAAP